MFHSITDPLCSCTISLSSSSRDAATGHSNIYPRLRQVCSLMKSRKNSASYKDLQSLAFTSPWGLVPRSPRSTASFGLNCGYSFWLIYSPGALYPISSVLLFVLPLLLNLLLLSQEHLRYIKTQQKHFIWSDIFTLELWLFFLSEVPCFLHPSVALYSAELVRKHISCPGRNVAGFIQITADSELSL